MTTATVEAGGGHPGPGARPAAAGVLGFLDVAAVVLVFPIVLLAGAPVAGYAAGAGVWIAQRAVGVATDRFAARSAEPRRALIVAIAGLFLRLWLVVLGIVAIARFGEREDGLTASLVVLAAFTVYFAIFLLTYQGSRPASEARR